MLSNNNIIDSSYSTVRWRIYFFVFKFEKYTGQVSQSFENYKKTVLCIIF